MQNVRQMFSIRFNARSGNSTLPYSDNWRQARAIAPLQ